MPCRSRSRDAERGAEAGDLGTRMNDLVRIERNPVLRAVPLEIKNLALMAGTTLGGRSITTVYSNIGRIQMPPEYEKHILSGSIFHQHRQSTDVFCSYGDSDGAWNHI